MLIIMLIRYILGFLRVEISGDFPEKVINCFSVNRTVFWNLVKKDGNIYVNIPKKDYKTVVEFKKKTGQQIKIVKKYGLPFLIKKYKTRYGIPIGAAMFISGLLIMPLFVWNLNVVGANSIDENAIKSALESLGVKEGTLIGNIDTRAIEPKMMLLFDDIAWCTLNIEDSIATFELTEKLDTDIMPTEPSNLIASDDGVITVIHVTNGTLKTKVGKTVRKGDLLASGVSEYKNGKNRFIRSSGEVIAKTVEQIEVFAEYSQNTSYRTDKIKSYFSFYTPFFELPLYFENPLYQFDLFKISNRIENSGAYLPFGIKKYTCYETVSKTITVSKETAKSIAYEKLEEEEKEKLGDAVIIKRMISEYEKKSGIMLKVGYICEKNIAIEEKILFDDK